MRKRPVEITLISIYFFIRAALAAIGFFGVLIVLALLPASPIVRKALSEIIGASAVAAFVGIIAAFISTILIFYTVIYLLIAVGLLKLKKWARILAIVFSILEIYVFFPIGTAIGVLILLYLFRKEASAIFKD